MSRPNDQSAYDNFDPSSIEAEVLQGRLGSRVVARPDENENAKWQDPALCIAQSGQ